MIEIIYVRSFDMKKILVLHTGGTIAMSKNDQGAVTPTDTNPLMAFDQLSTADYTVTAKSVFNLPSSHITPARMLELSQQVQQAVANGADGIVVTHGTDTLEETAYFLDLVVDTTVPIVLTGAMRSSNEVGSDGLHNLQSAIATAAADAAVGQGVLVVLNDEIHAARYVTKTHTTNVATFQTPLTGPLGILVAGEPRFFQHLLATTACPITTLVPSVYLLKAYAGMDATLFAAIDQPTTHGLVIEAPGAGNLPPETVPAIKALLAHQIPVVLVSRCFNGVAAPIYGDIGGGRQLADLGVIFCQGLNGQKARVKLQVAVSAGLKNVELQTFMQNANS